MAQKVSGGAGQSAKELINPRKGKWRIRFYMVEYENGTAEWVEHDFDHEPTETEIYNTIVEYNNKEVDEMIISGFVWRGMPVWLSTENQFNYKVAYDLAVQTGGANLPIRFKFGTNEKPVYHDFTTLEELDDFFKGAMYFIQRALMEGWEKKNSIDMSIYK